MKLRCVLDSASEPDIWWRTIFRGKEVVLPSGKVWKLDEAFAREFIQTFEDMTSRGYKPPVLKEHQREGLRYGAVVAVEAEQEADGNWRIGTGLQLYEPDARVRIDQGMYEAVSPGFGTVIDDQGTKFERALTEVSLVAAGHVKIDQSLGQQDADAILLSELVQQESMMEEFAARLVALEAMVKDFAERLTVRDAIQPQTPPAPEADPNPMNEDEEPQEPSDEPPAPEGEESSGDQPPIPPKKKEEEMDEKVLEQLAEKVATLSANKVIEQLKAGRVPLTAVPPQAPSKGDGLVVLRSEEELAEAAKREGVSDLAIYGMTDKYEIKF